MKKIKKGILIVIEGIDGSGKTTQAENIMARLKKREFDIVFFKEPTDGKWGRKIRDKARDPDSLTPEEELELFLKDRKENVSINLEPALKNKKIVLLDRYYFSTIAYQGAKGIDIDYIRRINEEFAVKPDLIFILDIEADKGLKRIEKRKSKDLLFEREDYLVRVRHIFNSFREENVWHVDANQPIDEISEMIENTILSYIETSQLG